MPGWIKLHRKLLDNPLMLRPELLQLFVYCLLRANHAETKMVWNGQEEMLEKGCFITGRKAIAEDLKQNERTTYDRLKVLQNLQMITLKSNNKFSIVKVLNYGIYQGEEAEAQQPANNQPTTSQQPANTDKNVKNDKNVKKVRDIFRPPTLEEVREYCQERRNNVDVQRWYDFYASKGWMVGKNKMKDWKAAVRTWERNNPQLGKPGGGQSNGLNRSQGVSGTNASQSSKYPIRNSQTP